MLLLFFCAYAKAGDYYIATNGNDGDPGTLAQPFATLEHALVNVAGAGDTIYMRGGSYHEEIVAANVAGASGNPITITNYNGEVVTMDGSEALSDLDGATWSVYSGNIYTTTISKDIWQLWVDGRMMMAGRWPNWTVGHPFDKPFKTEADGITPAAGTWWDPGMLAQMANPWDPDGNITNDATKHDLAAENVSFADGAIILNYAKQTFSRPMEQHTAGSNSFLHREVMNPDQQGAGWFYIESMNAIDRPGEWYYDMNTGEVRLYCEDGQTPQGRDVRGKTIHYALDVANMSYVTIDGIDFFGCGINSPNGLHVTIENCNFTYPSLEARMLGDHSYAGEPVNAKGDDQAEGGLVFQGNGNGTYYTMRNCRIEYSDMLVTMDNGAYDLVENCLFSYFNFSSRGHYFLFMNGSQDSTMSRCTFTVNPGKVCFKGNGVKTQNWSHASLFGWWMDDGTAFQTSGGQGAGGNSDGCVRKHHWIHDAVKGGVRWDGNNGINGTDHHEVIWNTKGGQMIKGDYHKVINNTVLNPVGLEADKAMQRILTEDAFGGQTMAYNNEVHNNLSHSMSSARSGYTPLVGNNSSNWNGWVEMPALAKDQVRDMDNLDFRPKAGSDIIDAGAVYALITDGYIGAAPDIGAYEFGDTHYWVPGYQSPQASTPVPPNGTTTAKPDCDLMWLAGYEAISHDVYFGTTPGNLTFQENRALADNIFDPIAGDLTAGQTYYWRIDTVTAAGTITGDEWSFTVPAPVVLEYVDVYPIADTYVRDDNPSTNYGTATELDLAHDTDASPRTRIGYMKFNINVPGPIVSADLNVWVTTSGNSNGTQAWSMTDTTWGELTMTYSNAPPQDGVLLDQIDIAGQTWGMLDVSATVTGNGIISLGLWRADNYTNARSVGSREHANAPYLRIGYEVGGGGNNPPDINGDGDINFEDFDFIFRNWLEACSAPDWCEGADLNISWLVDWQDVKEFCESWDGLP
jgi:hypothetical protein